METPKIFESEYRFCLILWEHEPVPSGKLVELCKENLGWSKATTYTVIRRLSERGVLKNENTIVSSLISKEEAQKSRLDEMVEETFEGSILDFGHVHGGHYLFLQILDKLRIADNLPGVLHHLVLNLTGNHTIPAADRSPPVFCRIGADIRFCAALRAVLICPLGHTDIHRCAALRTFYDTGQQMRVILTYVVITFFPTNGFDLLHLVKIFFGNKCLMGNKPVE